MMSYDPFFQHIRSPSVNMMMKCFLKLVMLIAEFLSEEFLFS